MAEAVTIARPYAVAAFRLAKEKNALSAWSDMLAFISSVVSDEKMRAYINDPKVKSEELERVLLSICSGKLDAPGENLVKMLVEYGRLPIVPEILKAFEELKAADEGVLQAEISSAEKMSEAETGLLVKSWKPSLARKLKRTSVWTRN